MQFFSQFHTTSLFQKQSSWDFPIDDYIVVEVRYTTSNTLYHLSHIYRFRMHYPPAHLKPSKGALKPYRQVKLTITTTKVLCWKHTIFVKLLVILHATDHTSYVRACTALQNSAQRCKALHSVAKLCTALQNSRVGYELR